MRIDDRMVVKMDLLLSAMVMTMVIVVPVVVPIVCGLVSETATTADHLETSPTKTSRRLCGTALIIRDTSCGSASS